MNLIWHCLFVICVRTVGRNTDKSLLLEGGFFIFINARPSDENAMNVYYTSKDQNGSKEMCKFFAENMIIKSGY